MHACISSVCSGCQTSIWLDDIAKVRWRSVPHSWIIEQHWADPRPRLAKRCIAQCHHLGMKKKSQRGLCCWELGVSEDSNRATHFIDVSIYFSNCLVFSHSSIRLKKDVSPSPFTQSWQSRLCFFPLFFFFFPAWGQRCSVPTERFCLSSLDVINNGWNSHSLTGRDCLEKTWKTIRNSASPGVLHRRQGPRSATN